MKTTEVIQIDLTNNGFDSSKWEGDVKPVKAFLTLKEIAGNESFKFTLEIGDMMFLMEDGTFQHADKNATDLKKKLNDVATRYTNWIEMTTKVLSKVKDI